MNDIYLHPLYIQQQERIKELEKELETIKSRIFEIEETLRSEDILPYGN